LGSTSIKKKDKIVLHYVKNKYIFVALIYHKPKKNIMKKSCLFPNYFKKIGWSLFCVCLIYFVAAWILDSISNDQSVLSLNFNGFAFITNQGWNSSNLLFFVFADTNFMSTGLPVISTLSLLFIGFSREKIEDECISKIREMSLVWAIIVNAIIFMVANLVIYGMVYLNIMMVFAYFFLITFILKFNYELYSFRKSVKYEE
jgi:hypothetical protein